MDSSDANGMSLMRRVNLIFRFSYTLPFVLASVCGVVCAVPYGAPWYVMVLVPVAVLFLVMQLCLMSSIGANIGEGVARLRIGEFTMQAMLVNVAGMLLWTFVSTLSADNNILWVLPAVLMLALGVYYFYRTVYKGLSGVVADVLRLEGRKRGDLPR